ncbi:MAG TPA: hypothetical protein VLW75_01445, partial [Rhizomicrobium sp.]|nr:hypothetical protein [Rhizomicrobium sp.]
MPKSTALRLRAFASCATTLVALGCAGLAFPTAAQAGGVVVHTGGAGPNALVDIPCGQLSVGTNITWQGAAPGDWFTASNWDVGVPDGSTDLVIIPSGTAQIDAAADGGTNVDICGGTLEMQAGGTLAATGAMAVGNGGTLLLNGSTTVPGIIAIDGG